jgi:hypothetical protein
MITVDHFGSGGNPFYVVMEVGGLGPLSLIPGYALAGDTNRGVAVAAGGYAVELVGSLVGGIGMATAYGGGGEGAGYAFLGGLFLGPAVAFGLYSLWATYDVYQTAERNAQSQ